MRRLAALTLATLLGLGAVGGCSGTRPSASVTGEARPGGDGPGALVGAEPMPDLDPAVADADIRAVRVTYRSTDATSGRPTVVSGTVLAPDGKPPEGGWRVVSLGHGSSGIENSCAPSASPDLSTQVGLAIRLVKLGVVVTMADYQGLGEPGVHRYLDSPTAGLNVIDAVRAARRTVRGVSRTWAALGGSQGGGAVWAANEEAAAYAPELDLVGVVALSPATDVTGLVDGAVAGTLTLDQRGTLQWLLASLGRQHPQLDLDLYRRGQAAAHWDELSTCGIQRVAAVQEIGPTDLAPATPTAAEALRSYLRPFALPRAPLSAPMLVAYGAKDTFLDPAWTTAALVRSCALGGVIEAHLDPDGTHAAVDAGDPAQWLADRFAGKPAKNGCP